MLGHLGGCRFFGADGAELPAADVLARIAEFRLPVREKYAGEDGWRLADLREDPGDYTMLFVELEPEVLARYGRRLLAGEHWLQRRTKYGDLSDAQLAAALDAVEAGQASPAGPASRPGAQAALRPSSTTCARSTSPCSRTCIDSRYYRTHGEPGAPAGKFSAKRRGYVVSMGQDLARRQDQRLDAHDPRVLRLRALLGRVPRLRRRRPGPHRPRLGHAPPLPHQLAGHRRRGPRQPGRRPPVQGLQRAAHAQRRAGRGRLHGAVPRASTATCTPTTRWGRGTPTTKATPPTTARRSPTPSTPPIWSTSRAGCWA